MSLPIVLRDETHQRADLDHFREPLDQILAWVAEELTDRPREGWAHFDFKCPRAVGFTSLKRLRPWDQSFWAPRQGRVIPSHLIVGHKRLTRWLCVGGRWRDDNTFMLHTAEPGRRAPREIHDPDIEWSELGPAVAFWSRHAIVVSAGEWE